VLNPLLTPERKWTLAAMGSSLVGIGLARLAFDPLQAALVEANWFTDGAAAYLADANLIGYVLGALVAKWLAQRVPTIMLLRVMMIAISLSFLLCFSESMPFQWFFFWRVISGIAGGIIMVVASPTVLAHIAAKRRGAIGQMSLYGLALGVLIAGTLVPLLLTQGPTAVWLGIGFICLAITVFTWRLWPPAPKAPDTPFAKAKAPRAAYRLWLEYGLVAVGVVTHMVFLVPYLEQNLQMSGSVAAQFFLVYAAGALTGPFVFAYLANRLGIHSAQRVAMPILLAANAAMLLLSFSYFGVGLSCFLAGLCLPGIISIFLGLSQELAQGDPNKHRAIWGTATVVFAVTQAGVGYVTAFTLSRFGTAYQELFLAATVSVLLAIVVDLLPRQKHHQDLILPLPTTPTTP
jgi:predicted MFS family arabinose efflux permease